IAAICTLWLLYWIATSIHFSGAAHPPNTAARRIEAEMNAKLAARPEFADVGFAITSERPPKFQVVGYVASEADFEALGAFLKEIRPEGDYELVVQPPPGTR